MKEMTILLTGFEPFDGEAINPSWELARALDGQSIGDARIVARRLPCVFGEALAALRQGLDATRPGLWPCGVNFLPCTNALKCIASPDKTNGPVNGPVFVW